MKLLFKSVLLIVCLLFPGAFCRAKSLDHVMVDDVMVEAGSNVSIGCPGMTRNTFVVQLEWRCRGDCTNTGTSNQKVLNVKDNEEELILIKYVKDQETKLLSNTDRIRLEMDMFALAFDPVLDKDEGRYLCLINNRPLPDAVIQLNVLDVPDPPGRPMVTRFTSRSVTLSWTQSKRNLDAPITGYIVTTGWRQVEEDDDSEFHYLEQEIHTNSSVASYTIEHLQPYTVYSFQVCAVNHVGRSRSSKNSYPSITLREKPSGKPRVTAAHNTSSTSLYLSWQAPELNTIHGEFLGYKISYRPRDVSEVKAVDIPIENPRATSYTLTGLNTYTQYLVSLRAYNPAGDGPETIVVVMTDEGAPSRPRNVKVLAITDETIRISWWEPARANGVLQGYRIYMLHQNFTSVQTVRTNKSSTAETLTRLKPYAAYKIWIKAYTVKNEGKSSEPVDVTTDVRAPGQPIVVNLTCQNGHTLFLKWLRPTQFFRTVDVYNVHYKPEEKPEWEKQVVETVNNTINHMMYLNNLTTNKVYELKIQAGTRSQVGERLMHFGPFSQMQRVLLQDGCEAMRTFAPRSTEKNDSVMLINLDDHLGTIAGAVCGTLGLLLAVFAFLLWRRYTQESNPYYYPHEKYYGQGPTPELPGWDNNSSTSDGEHAIPVHLFPKHVSELHLDQDVGFSKEYEEIRADSCLDEYTAQDSQHPDNKDKNRYPNIVAYDHTRVRLRSKADEDKDDYLNANFVDGFRQPRAYIATQGPIQGTFPAFWKMVWEQNTQVIVMITHLFENGKPKCDLYWPDSGTETYGDMLVSLLREDILASYTLRTFSIRYMKPNVSTGTVKKEMASIERTVYQYHFTAWPDHGVPLHALPLVSFVRNSAAANACDAGPIVVHCSAGVGRTGCYIVLDAMLRQIESRGDVNIFSFLKHIRNQRAHLVQTEEQYVFIHDALVEVIEAGETHINKTALPRYIHSLQCIDVTDEKNHPPKVLEKQHKLVANYHPGKSQYSTAMRVINQPKNRCPDFLATDSARVFLNPGGELDGDDYVNASWLMGFFDRREFIVTQHPTDRTICDFWRMVWEQDTRLVLALSSIDSQECRPFWPSMIGETLFWDTNKRGEQLRLTLLEEVDTFAKRSIRLNLELCVPNSTGGPSREVWIFLSPSWPQQCSPLSTVFDLVKVTDEEHQVLGGGPIVTVDRYGGTQASTFCCLMTLWHQLHFEGGVDIYQLAKLAHYNRPGVFKHAEDILFLYCALEAYVTNNGTTIPSPVDIEAWRNSASGYQLNGCVRVSRVYTDSVAKVLKVSGTDDDRIPPDGQESAALLKHNELNGNGSCPVVGCTVPIVPLNNVAVVSHNGTLISNDGTLISNNGTLISNNGTLKRS